MRIRFDDCFLDSERRELTREREPVYLTRKAFDLLVHLIERRPKTVSVDTSHTHQLIEEIREAVHDHQHHIVRTVHGRGYAFAAPALIVDDDTPSRCRFLIAGQRFDLRDGENIVGRSYSAAVRIQSLGVSRRHASLSVSDTSVFITDLGSRNGTFVNGQRIRGAVPITPAALITFGCVSGALGIVKPL